MERNGSKCRCIRCREVGHKLFQRREEEGEEPLDFERISLLRREYDSSGGREIFLSYEDEASDTLYAFLRLRIPSGKEYQKRNQGSIHHLS